MRSQTFTQIFAADALVEPNLHVGNNHVDSVRHIARGVFNAIHWTEGHTRFAAGAVIRIDDRNFLRLLFLSCDLRRGFGNDECGVRLLCIKTCHGLMHS